MFSQRYVCCATGSPSDDLRDMESNCATQDLCYDLPDITFVGLSKCPR